MTEFVSGQINQLHASSTDETVCPTRCYAGFWMRFWAYLIDLLILGSINSLLMGPFKLFTNLSQSVFGSWTIYSVVAFVIYFTYFTLTTKFFKQTIGKMILGIEVVREDGKALTWGDVLIRECVGRFIYKSFFILQFLYVVIAFTPEKEGLHDIFAQTRVTFRKEKSAS